MEDINEIVQQKIFFLKKLYEFFKKDLAAISSYQNAIRPLFINLIYLK